MKLIQEDEFINCVMDLLRELGLNEAFLGVERVKRIKKDIRYIADAITDSENEVMDEHEIRYHDAANPDD